MQFRHLVFVIVILDFSPIVGSQVLFGCDGTHECIHIAIPAVYLKVYAVDKVGRIGGQEEDSIGHINGPTEAADRVKLFQEKSRNGIVQRRGQHMS